MMDSGGGAGGAPSKKSYAKVASNDDLLLDI